MGTMATVNKEIARRLVENDGVFEGDPRVYCVVMYQNRTKYGEEGEIVYDPEKPGSCWDFAVYYDRERYLDMYDSPVVGGVEILWGSEQFFRDEVEEMDWEDRFDMLVNELHAASCGGEEGDGLTWLDEAKIVARKKMVEAIKDLENRFL